MSQTLKTAIAVVAIDIGKNSFHVVGLDQRAAIVLRKKWSRGQVGARFANMPPCLIGFVLGRERLKAGDSDAQVIDFLVARYGEFVLLKPPLSWHTAALWGLPPALLLIGIGMIVVVVRRRRAAPLAETANLTAAEEARLANLMREEG